MGRLFDSSTDAINFTDDTALNVLGAVSITAWVYLNAASVTHCVLCKNRTTSRDTPYEFRFFSEASPQRLFFFRAGATSPWTNATSASGVAISGWHHVAVTCSGGSGSVAVKFYIDGVLNSTSNLTSQPAVTSTTNPAKVGNRQSGFACNNRLAHVALYSRVLGLNEILNDRAHGRFDCPELVLYVPLWYVEGSPTNEPDLSGFRRIGALAGSPVVTTNPPYVGPYGAYPFQRGGWAQASAGGQAWSWTGLETQGQTDTLNRFLLRAAAETQPQSDAVARIIFRNLLDTQAQADTVTRLGQAHFRTLAETQAQTDNIARFVGWLGTDTQAQVDTALRNLARLLTETAPQADTVLGIKNGGSTFYQWEGLETQAQADDISRNILWAGVQTQAQVDTVNRNLAILLTEGQPQSDTVIRAIVKTLAQNQTVADIVNRAFTRVLAESQSEADFIASFVAGSVTAEVIKLLGGRVTAAGQIGAANIGAGAEILGGKVTAAGAATTPELP